VENGVSAVNGPSRRAILSSGGACGVCESSAPSGGAGAVSPLPPSFSGGVGASALSEPLGGRKREWGMVPAFS